MKEDIVTRVSKRTGITEGHVRRVIRYIWSDVHYRLRNPLTMGLGIILKGFLTLRFDYLKACKKLHHQMRIHSVEYCDNSVTYSKLKKILRKHDELRTGKKKRPWKSFLGIRISSAQKWGLNYDIKTDSYAYKESGRQGESHEEDNSK